MGILFIVNRARALDGCLAIAEAADAVLLIEDGVYAATRTCAWPGAIYALEPDVRARGLLERLAPEVRLVSDAGFVDLAATHQPIVTWR